MCGIFSLLNNYNYQAFSQTFVETQYNKGVCLHTKKTELKMVGHKIIMGVNEHEQPTNNIQPIIYNDIVLLCDGEIFNYKELYEYTGITNPITTRSCEIIIYLYLKYGIEHTLQLIDGEYSFILLDNCIHTDNYNLFVARDPYGVKPLFILYPEKNESIDERKRIIGFSSEKKVLDEFFDNLENIEYNDRYKNKEKQKYYLKQFQPGTYSSYYLSSKVFSSWSVNKKFERYHSNAFNSLMYISSPQYNIDKLFNDMREYLYNSIQKRCDIIRQRQEKIACLISGDNDSRLMISQIKKYCSSLTNTIIEIETYSFGIEGSDELKNAREIAYQYGTKHNEIKYTPDENEFVSRCYPIEITNEYEMDKAIELVGKYISDNNNIKFLFVAHGLSELSGANIINITEPIEFDKIVREQINNIHNTKLLRLNRCFYSYGIEITAPFLDRAFVQNYLSIPSQVRCMESREPTVQ